MTDTMEEKESYTYGERLTASNISEKDIEFREGPNFFKDIMHKWLVNCEGSRRSVFWNKNDYGTNICLNQIEWIIDTYKKYGHRNNQMVLQIAQPTDLLLVDPPCLRQIDTRIQDNKLHFFVYFRSWDLWAGLPANLAGIQTVKEYMATAIGVEDGEMVVESKGLHLYAYAEKIAKLRCMVNDNLK
jgi:thymidylate synthase